MSGTTCSNRSSPSSRLIELTTAFPWQRLRACSSTAASVESSMSGTFTLRVRTSRKAVMSASSSRSGLARQTSSTCAPPRTCRRPISAAWSRSPAITSSLKRRLAVVIDRQHLDARDDGTPGRAGAAGWVAAGELGDQTHVLGGRAAAAAHEVHPSLGAEALELPDQALGRLVVALLLIRQPGVREAGHR